MTTRLASRRLRHLSKILRSRLALTVQARTDAEVLRDEPFQVETMPDPIVDAVRSLALHGGVFLEAQLSEPWALRAQVVEEDCAPFMEMPEQVIAFHIVTQGELLLSMDSESPTSVSAGHIILIPRNEQHLLMSDVDAPPALSDDLIQQTDSPGLGRIVYGGGGKPTRILCGFLASRTGTSPIIDILPRCSVLQLEDLAAQEWAEASIRLAARELGRGQLASTYMTSQLTELIVIEALRHSNVVTGAPGHWLAGIADRRISRALVAMHKAPESSWSIESLAKVATLSRSAFIERFTTVMGVAPHRYLVHVRLTRARGLLTESSLSIGEIAALVGYDAPESFSRAFKREFGVPPAAWRSHH